MIVLDFIILDCALFIFLLLFLYMFCRLIAALLKKGILDRDDIFYITSNPWEYKKYKEKNQKNTEGS